MNPNPRPSSKRTILIVIIGMGTLLLDSKIANADEQKGRLTQDFKVGVSHDISLKTGQVVEVLKQSGQMVVIMVPAADGSTGIYQVDKTNVEILPMTQPAGALANPFNTNQVLSPQTSGGMASSIHPGSPATPVSSPTPNLTTTNSSSAAVQMKNAIQAPSGLAADLQGHLVKMDNGELKDVDSSTLQGIKYWAIYFSASWCPDCNPVTPELVRFYKNFKPDHPNFELILVCHDKTADAMLSYMKGDEMPWLALPFSDVWNTHLWPLHYIARGIPNLVLVDDTGKVLSQTYRDGTPRSAQMVIDDIKAMVPAADAQPQL